MTSVRVLTSGTLLLFLAACAATDMKSAQVDRPLPPAEAPTFHVGDVFTYTISGAEEVEKVTAVDGDTITIDSTFFGTMTQPRHFSHPPSWTGRIANRKTFQADDDMKGLFPLELGKTVSTHAHNRYGNRTSSGTLTCSVPRQEAISVPAGRFDTFVVRCDFSTGHSTITDTYWYAPAVDHWVAVSRNGALYQLVSLEDGS